MNEPFDDPIGRMILGSFGASHAEWRTLGGIERCSGLSQQEVRSYIQQHAQYFTQSPISPSGMPLFRPDLHARGGQSW
jgi:hypothetical protein